MQQTYYKTFGEMPTGTAAAADLSKDPALAPIIDSASKSAGTPFTGAWSQIQLALVNVVVQSVPDLSAHKVDEAKLTTLLNQAQTSAQAALDKTK
jgi:multiple sugar transport system substrate-binding protein